MRLQPRREMLEIWRAVARHNGAEGEWVWEGRFGRNSISDAEQLLCIMYPASLVKSFQLDRPANTEKAMLNALGRMGDRSDLPRRLLDLLTEYMQTYTDKESGAPDFSGGSYFRSAESGVKPTDEQLRLHVVDSYSISVTLTLATLGFLRIFRDQITRADLKAKVEELEALASRRLSAAMVGLLRSFTVNVYGDDSLPWKTLMRTVGRRGQSSERLVADLQDRLQEVRSGLRDLSIGSGQVVDDLSDPSLLFECGWTWGTLAGAPEIKTTEEVGRQGEGQAEDRPLLYFTTNALAGIVDLTSERTRVLRLLNEEQQRLAQALQLRYDLTRSYWATVASSETTTGVRLAEDRWPLEDIPWRTSDGEESDYFSLLVTSLVTHDLSRRGAPDSDLRRVFSVLQELSSRGRVTRRPLTNDVAIELHTPGVPLRLGGSKTPAGPQLNWVVSDFAVMLLKRVATLAGLARSPELRSQLTALIDQVWDHLAERRMDDGRPGSLWDQAPATWDMPEGATEGTKADRPSWYHTERVMECLVMLSDLILKKPTRSDLLAQQARDRITEAEQLVDRQLFAGAMEAGPAVRGRLQELRSKLQRAQSALAEMPATADSLASEVLRGLDELEAAQENAAE
ncbi:SCO2524 family protein [Cryptosporangium sp. NPDC051539]|uniref:SCO2524 family protein n=1 Tax=Cryptosporangium sp. NPDC051539 TaxID=3363962 RepID=UPI0037A1DA9D